MSGPELIGEILPRVMASMNPNKESQDYAEYQASGEGPGVAGAEGPRNPMSEHMEKMRELAKAAHTTPEERQAQAIALLDEVPAAHRQHIEYRFRFVPKHWKLRWIRAVLGKSSISSSIKAWCAECLG